MELTTKIHIARPEDIPAILEIAKASFPDPWTEALFRQTLEQNSAPFWCAGDGNRVLGYLVLSFCGDAVSIDDIAVHPAYRRHGIAGQLLNHAIQAYPDREFWLEVRQSNLSAIRLYHSFGFLQTGLRRRYYQNPAEDAILMTKNSKIMINRE